MLDQKKNIHFTGIKGAGVAALALMLQEKGHNVCGSDVADVFFTDALLHKGGIKIECFSSDHITSALDLLIYSTAYPPDHPELVAAKEKGVPIMSYPEALSLFFNDSYGIAVCGSHGKTTTSAMLAYLLVRLGVGPNALVGSEIKQLGSNMCSGPSQFFILEADEYQNKFSHYQPHIIILTSIDYDHPDYFKNEEEYRKVFTDFVARIQGRNTVACWDDSGVRASLAHIDGRTIVTYGWDPSYDYAATNYHMENGRRTFTLLKSGVVLGEFSLSIIGKHNVSNALAVIATTDLLGLCTPAKAAEILGEFTGTARRFETKGAYKHITVIDDYAHHPTEIRATLHAARHQYPGKKIWCVFAPHTYSRTKAFLSQFADSFHHVDRVIVLDIYTSARENESTIHSSQLVEEINKASGNAGYAESQDVAEKMVIEHEGEIDILITMGAGDVNKLAESLVALRVS